MDYSQFIKLLNDQAKPVNVTTARHIVRFRDSRQFRSFLRQMNRLKSTMKHLKYIQPLKIIHGFYCSLESSRTMMRFPFIQNIETDEKINVHALPRRNAPPIKQDSSIIPWGVQHIKAPRVWRTTTGENIRVSVIDTGVDYSHPDLQGVLGRGVNLINRFIPPYDDNGHGTHIAGTIAAANFKDGMIGVAPGATVYPIKAFDYRGTAYISDIISAIEWSIRNQMNIINMSFGMSHHSEAIEEAVKSAHAQGIVIVASSGNDGTKGVIDYPARFAETICVGATTKSRKIAPFSNRGKRVDIFAPGEQILSTWLRGQYFELSGTSMATSHVSGVIALLLQKYPRLTPNQIKRILRRGATPLKGIRSAKVPGEINVYQELRAVRQKKSPAVRRRKSNAKST